MQDVSDSQAISPRSFEDRLQDLCDKQELLELVTRYCRAVDRCDLDLLLSCYHEDAIDDHGTFRGQPVEVFPPIIARFKNLPAMQHILSNASFELDGDVAYGEVYMSVRMGGSESLQQPESFGRNLDRYERRNGEWRIVERVVIIERHNFGSDTDPKTVLAGTKDRTDPSYRPGFSEASKSIAGAEFQR